MIKLAFKLSGMMLWRNHSANILHYSLKHWEEKGVNSRINQYLGRPLLYLACHHLIYECHIKNVSKLFRTSCPDNPLFKRLSENFLNVEVDQNKLCKYVYGKNIELDNVAKKTHWQWLTKFLLKSNYLQVITLS